MNHHRKSSGRRSKSCHCIQIEYNSFCNVHRLIELLQSHTCRVKWRGFRKLGVALQVFCVQFLLLMVILQDTFCTLHAFQNYSCCNLASHVIHGPDSPIPSISMNGQMHESGARPSFQYALGAQSLELRLLKSTSCFCILTGLWKESLFWIFSSSCFGHFMNTMMWTI